MLSVDLSLGEPNPALTYRSKVRFTITRASGGKVLERIIAVKYKIKVESRPEDKD